MVSATSRFRLETLIRTYVSECLLYRGEIVAWMLAACTPVVMLMLWTELEARGATIELTSGTLVAYFLASYAVAELTCMWVVGEMGRDIKFGSIAPHLLRPIHPLWIYAAQHISGHAVRLPIVIMVTLIGGLALGASIELSMSQFWLLCVLPLVWHLHFAIHSCVAMLGFWLEDAAPLNAITVTTCLLGSGAIAPLSFYPAAAAAILQVTPLPYLVDFPARLAIGDLGPAELAEGLSALVLWNVAIACLQRLLWRCGVARYEAGGS